MASPSSGSICTPEPLIAVADLRASGATTPSAITRGLNELGVPAPRGGVWTIAQTQRLLARLGGEGRSLRIEGVLRALALRDRQIEALAR
jgi:hypothetical protein